MKRKRLILVITGVTMLALVLLWMWPFSPYDFSKVHPSIQNLKQPHQKVLVNYYLDGGSVGLKIADKEGAILQLALPVSDGPAYKRLYIGAANAYDTNAIEVAFSEDTKRYLINIIERDAEGMDRDVALIALRGAPRDYIGGLIRVVFRKDANP